MEMVHVHGAGGDVGGHGLEGLKVKVRSLEDLGVLFRQWHDNVVIILAHVGLLKKCTERNVRYGQIR